MQEYCCPLKSITRFLWSGPFPFRGKLMSMKEDYLSFLNNFLCGKLMTEDYLSFKIHKQLIKLPNFL